MKFAPPASLRLPQAAFATVLAVSVASAAAAAPAAAPQAALPAFSLLPAHVGGSVSFHYDANESSPRGQSSTHAVITLTRVVNDRVAITVTPDDGAPVAVLGRIENGGGLRIEGGSRFAGSSPARAGGAPSADGDIPLDRPIGGLPGQTGSGQGGYGGRGQGQGTDGAARAGATFERGSAQRAAVPSSITVIAALVAGRPQAGSAAHGWSFSAPAGASEGFVPLTARVESVRGGVASVVADGSGEVQVTANDAPAAAQSRAASQNGGYGGYGGRRRGGASGQGGYGGYGNGGVYAQQATVSATVAYHVESAFRGGRLTLARGSETTTPHGAGTQSPTTVRWTLTPL
jgi:hypothetical protein